MIILVLMITNAIIIVIVIQVEKNNKDIGWLRIIVYQDSVTRHVQKQDIQNHFQEISPMDLQEMLDYAFKILLVMILRN